MNRLIVTIVCIVLTASSVYANDIEQEDFIDDPMVYESYLEKNTDPKDDNGLGYYYQGQLALSTFKYDLAYQNFEKAYEYSINNTSLHVHVLYQLAEMDHYFNNIAQMTERAFELNELSKEVTNPKYEIESLMLIAESYIYHYETNTGIEFINASYNLAQEHDYLHGMINYFIILGDLNYYNGDYEKSNENYLEAYRLATSFNSNYIVEHPKQKLNRYIALNYLSLNNEKVALNYIEDYQDHIIDGNHFANFQLQRLYGYYYLDLNQSYDSLKSALYSLNRANLPYFAQTDYKNLNQDLGQLAYELEDYESTANYLYAYMNTSGTDSDEETQLAVDSLEAAKMEKYFDELSLLEQLNETEKEKVDFRNRVVVLQSIIIVIGLISIIVSIRQIKQKKKSEKKFYQQSITDSLTNIYNRRKIFELFESHLRPENSVILLDIDDFKAINDQYGHIVGDEVLIKIAEVIGKSIRTCDVVGRYGGEEFLVLISHTTTSELIEISNRICDSIAEIDWSYDNLTTTASLGVTTCFSKDAEEVLHKVDNLMYKAKHTGKNKVIFDIKENLTS